MNTDEVTAQIMGAWDEVVSEDERAAEPEDEAAVTVDEPEPEEEEEAEEDEETEGDDEEEPEEDEGEEEAEEESETEEDVEVKAFLAKYGNDPEKALKGAADLYRLMGRRDEEKATLARQVEDLQRSLAEARTFATTGGILNEEQQAWVESAAESPNPAVYVQQAMQAGEFELARAVCREWAQTNPYEALRVGQFIDATEVQAVQAQSAPAQVPPTETWQALASHFPELRQYEEAMVETLQRMGADHPSVIEARSTDPATAARGIMHIYDVAKASTFALADARAGLKRKRRREADAAADNAVVTSASASPSGGETPRQRRLLPGLTQEAFDAAFEEARTARR